MPSLRESQHPEPIAMRAKTLGKGSGTFARKPAIEANEPRRIREERALAAEFGDALDDAGVSNVEASRLMGISEVRVRAIRRRECPLQFRQVGHLPPKVRDRLLVALFRICSPESLRADAANDADAG
jgi:hypothetical protein